MIHLIDELKIIPGVIGASIVSSQDGLKVTNLPTIFKPERLTTIGKHLFKLSSVGRMSFDDLTDISLHYDESVMLARELEKGMLLFVICDPTFNHNLLSMSFNLLQEEFNLGNYSTPGEEDSPIEGDVTSSQTQPDMQVDDALQELFDELKSSLGIILGPMASFVFDEVVEDWTSQGSVDPSRLGELLGQLDQEISDQDKIDKYRQLISPALETFLKG